MGLRAWVKDKAKKAKREVQYRSSQIRRSVTLRRPPVMLSGLLERLRMKPSA